MATDVRDAATVILVRRGPDGGYDVLLTQRPPTMRFMGGMYVFPGGALDADDCAPALAERSALSRVAASAALGEDIEPARALGLYCCALRELFEEVGILHARTADGRPVDPAAVREVYLPRRHEIGASGEAFAAFLASEGLVLATDVLVRHGRLVTPEMSPIRFDARFFVAPVPDGQEVVPDPVEVPHVVWLAPIEAIAQSARGDLAVPIPTMAILQGMSEVPGYEQLLRGERAERAIHVHPLSPLVSSVLAPNPGLATGPGTNSYVVGSGETVIIDPAVPDPIYIEALVREAGGRGRPSLVLVTHMHPDHIGGAGVLAEQLGVEVGGWAGATEMYPIVTKPLVDGDVVRVGGATLRALHTPGHASHHLCFLLEEERSLFAGDVVAGIGTVVIAPPDGDMAQYLETLAKLGELGIRRIYPGHGPLIEDGPAKIDEYIAHRRDREAQVLACVTDGIRTIPSMVERIYADVPKSLHAMAELSVRAHLEMLERTGRVHPQGDAWLPA